MSIAEKTGNEKKRFCAVEQGEEKFKNFNEDIKIFPIIL